MFTENFANYLCHGALDAVSEEAVRHLRSLAAQIGPRGSCTPAERRASEYCAQVMSQLGYAVRSHEFATPRSGWAPFSLASGLVLLAVGAASLRPAGSVGALLAALVVVVTISLLLQIAFRPNPLSWLVPKGRSQNVYAVARPRGRVEQTVVVAGHVDTHRTPWAMVSPAAFRAFRVLTTAAVVSFIVLSGLLIASVVGFDVRAISWPFAAVVAVAFVVTLQPEFSPFVPGANDNASGAAAVLSLAARLSTTPLQRTEVWLVNSGAEEVGATGPMRLLHPHPELRSAAWLVIDTIAGPGTDPCLITAEQVLFPLRADPALLAAGRTVASQRPELGVREHYYRGLFSEHSPLAAAGCRSLAIINFTPEGYLPNWHRPSDTVGNADLDVLDRTERFIWEILQFLDRGGDQG